MTVAVPELANTKLAIIGLGYVGLPLAVEFSKKRRVIGFDIDKQRITEITRKEDRTAELGYEELEAAENLRVTCSIDDIVNCNVYIVTVPTPVDIHKKPDLGPLLSASRTVGKVLRLGDVVIYESTVYPGCTEEECVPILEEVSGLKYNKQFTCGYSPERINPGDKKHKIATIKKITSGSTLETANYVNQLYESVVVVGTHRASSIKVAEAAKIIENTQRDINIALMNELSMVFERIGVDTLEVLAAAESKWNFLPFRPGLVGGHCIGVDPYYLTSKAEMLGYSPQVILAGRKVNDQMHEFIAAQSVKLMIANGIPVANARVGILGVTFKENCPDPRNSRVVNLVREYEEWGFCVKIIDPVVDADALKNLYNMQLTEISPREKVDILVVAVAHDCFKSIDLNVMKSYIAPENKIIYDVKGILDRERAKALGLIVRRL